LPPVAKDEFYWADLIGLDVVNTNDQSLGQVLGLIETSANDVLRVGDGSEKERLLPFVAAVVLDVDLSARRVRVDWEMDW
jgi:16S rRNA processing protein RimM